MCQKGDPAQHIVSWMMASMTRQLVLFGTIVSVLETKQTLSFFKCNIPSPNCVSNWKALDAPRPNHAPSRRQLPRWMLIIAAATGPGSDILLSYRKVRTALNLLRHRSKDWNWLWKLNSFVTLRYEKSSSIWKELFYLHLAVAIPLLLTVKIVLNPIHFIHMYLNVFCFRGTFVSDLVFLSTQQYT